MIINIFLGTFFALYLLGLIFTLGLMLKEWIKKIKGFHDNFIMLCGLLAWPLLLGFYIQEELILQIKKIKNVN